jgi:Protein of unknown function (DUF2630)
MESMMNDSAIHKHIEELVAEEHRLYEAADDRSLTPDEHKRLDEVNVQLDRYYDLLRQRRARREFGADPDAAHMRSGKTVESYVE